MHSYTQEIQKDIVNGYRYLDRLDLDSAKSRAVQILQNTPCMSLSTLHETEEGKIKPRTICVEFTYNPDGIYWVSAKDSIHSIDISKESEVSIAIADLKAPREKRQGIFIDAKAYEINNLEEIQKVYWLFHQRIGENMKFIEEWVKIRMGDFPRRVYKAIPYALGINYSVSLEFGFSRDCVDKTLYIPLDEDFRKSMRVL